MTPFEPSLVRRALDELLARYPHLDLLHVEWQVDPPDGRSVARWSGPWVLVRLGQPSDLVEVEPAWAIWYFAIWRVTGAVHTMEAPHGPVSDDPVLTPGEVKGG